jgi:hypothetical protein
MNPFQAPAGPAEVTPRNSARVEFVAIGQKAVIYAILVNLCAVALRSVLGPVFLPLALVGLALSLFGIYRLSSGLGMSTGTKVALFICMAIPLVSLVTLFVLNSKATRVLRAAGYRVGLLGASK